MSMERRARRALLLMALLVCTSFGGLTASADSMRTEIINSVVAARKAME